MRRAVARATLALLIALGAATAVAAAEAPRRIGLVTTLAGNAAVVRAGQSEPRPLKFKDDVFSGDTVRTAAESIVRVLVRGTTLVAASESSAVRISDDGSRAVVGLDAGKVSVVVTRAAGRPDDAVEIRTSDLVVSLRGTSVVAELVKLSGERAEPRTNLYVLSGTADVRHARAAGSPTVTLKAFESVSVTAGALGPVQALTADAAVLLMKDFRLGPQHTGAPEQAVRDIGARGQSDADAEAQALRRQGVKGIPSPADAARRPVVPIQPSIPAGQQGPRGCC